MTVVRLIKGGVIGVIAAGVLTGFTGVAPAYAGSPWWHLSSASRPTYLQPGQAKDEVQQLTVSATEGLYLLRAEGSAGEVAGETILEVGETPGQVQVSLEEIYGAGNVEVTGGPGAGNNPYEVYEVRFKGKFTDERIATMTIPIAALTRGSEEGSASVKELSKGRPDGVIVVTAVNLGDANANAETQSVTVTDVLPAGLTAVGIEGAVNEELSAFGSNAHRLECSLGSLSCTFTGKSNAPEFPSSVPPYNQIQVRIAVNMTNVDSGDVNEATVTGGGAPTETARQSLTVSDTTPSFGAGTYEMRPEEAGGGVDTQAGSHPFQLTTTLTFNETFEGRPVGLSKDLHFKLPPGLIGNPTPFAQCALTQFLKTPTGTDNECSAQTVVGVAKVTVNLSAEGSRIVVPFTEPLFNLEPAVGEPARFGFLVEKVPVLLDTAVRTGGDYGVTVSVTNITQAIEFLGSEVTFWGVPGDARHDNARNWDCLQGANAAAQGKEHATCPAFEVVRPSPLLALPTSCTGPLQTMIEADSWQQPGIVASLPSTKPLPALDGCNQLQFDPSISVAPDGQGGSTPTGLTVGVHVPQDVSLDAEGLSEADVKDTTVALPAGVTLNPAAADGLQACSEAQIALDSPGASGCPEASKVGTVEIKTPLLPNPLRGATYVAAQNANPFGSLVALYVFAEDPVSGSRVKLVGEVKPGPVTGQLVSTFLNTPQLPFEDFKLHFFGGNRAPLSTPALCGTYTTIASIASWSGNENATSFSMFDITSGPNGGPCENPLPFTPTLTAGTTSIQAGGFSPFTMTMSREDGQQNLQAISLKMPPGLSGLLSNVKLCGEPQADQGTCGPESEIGETIVSVGVGGDPFSVRGGKVFVTGPYQGAPYGLSIVNPAKAGPYDLEAGTPCDCVVVRAKIEVDLTTAALTITSDNSGPYEIPHILDGIPLQIKHVNVTINRPEFTFNPTNCNPMSLTGSLSSVEGATSTLSVPLQVTNCAVLGFKPGFSVSTAGKTSRANGASLHVKLVYPKAPFGSQANIAKVKVDLPKQLPSRLTTLQKACPDSTFNQNPANCSAQSRIGQAKATTPLLPVPLTGPAYFVSHGGAKFPELVIVLSGYGTTVQLHAETFISPAGITSSTFRTVPDVPVGTFELTLPQGKYSALAANGNLCKSALKMPTAFTAQNGAVIKQATPIAVGGCPKRKAKASHAHRRARPRRRG